MYHSETTPIVTLGLSVRHPSRNAFKSLCISMLSWLAVSPAEKTSSNIWWIGKVVVPLHSQLKRTGFRKCLSLMSGEQVLLVGVTLAYLYILGARRTSEALEKKTSPKIWWFQKVVVPLHSQLQRKGGRKCPIHGWSLVAMMADRNACGVYKMTRSSSRSRDSMRRLLKRVSDR